MASKLFKKGALVLAFAAVVGWGIHRDPRNPNESHVPERDYTVQTGTVDVHAYASAKDAVIFEQRNVDLDKALAKGTITKDVHDREVKSDDQQIASLREQFRNKPVMLAEFDQVFLGLLKQRGITPPAKPPQLDQPATPVPGAPKPSS